MSKILSARSLRQNVEGIDLFSGTPAGELPVPAADDLEQIQSQGFLRLGVLGIFVDERRRLLVGRHRPSNKIPDIPRGALGFMAETSQWTAQGGFKVETVAHTLARGVHEEMGVNTPSNLALEVHPGRSWFTEGWPVGVRYPDQLAAAVCAVMHMPAAQIDELVATFQPGPDQEMLELQSMSPRELRGHFEVRPGVHAVLHRVITSGLLETVSDERQGYRLPDHTALPQASDVIFSEMGTY